MTGSLTNSYDILLAKIKQYVDAEVNKLFVAQTVTTVNAANAANGLVFTQEIQDNTQDPPVVSIVPITQILEGLNMDFTFSTIGGVITLTVGASDTVLSFAGNFENISDLPTTAALNSIALVANGSNGAPEAFLYTQTGWKMLFETPLIADWTKQVVLSVNDTFADTTGNVSLGLSVQNQTFWFDIDQYPDFPQPSSVITQTNVQAYDFILGGEISVLPQDIFTAVTQFNFDSIIVMGMPASPITATSTAQQPTVANFAPFSTTQALILELTEQATGGVIGYNASLVSTVVADGTNMTLTVTITFTGDWNESPGYYSFANLIVPTPGAVTSVNGVLPDGSGNVNVITTQHANIADHLTTPRNISSTGDVTWTVLFDGSQNVSGAATLANTGVNAGTYTKLTVDAKGRVLTAGNLTQSDIPLLTQYVRSVQGVGVDGNGNVNINFPVTSVNGMTGAVTVTNISGNANYANSAGVLANVPAENPWTGSYLAVAQGNQILQSPANTVTVKGANYWVDSSGDYVAFNRTYNPSPEYVIGINSDSDWSASVTTLSEVASRGVSLQNVMFTAGSNQPMGAGSWNLIGQILLTNSIVLNAWELVAHQ